MQQRQYLSTGELAKLCNMTKHTVLTAIGNGVITTSRTPGGHHRIHVDEAKVFLESHAIPVTKLAGVMPSILVVDDDKDTLELIRRALANESVIVEMARCGYDAGAMAAKMRPQLIVLDILLPDIDGRTICRQIRQNPVSRNTRVLAISGLRGKEEEESIYAAGVDDYLQKPFSLQELRAKITTLLRRAPQPHETAH
ncbi:MAG: response regulator [Planctomycetes bacterium]|nr:response regulator [Planctomycetota bacterium]